jgi:hypothetical protein
LEKGKMAAKSWSYLFVVTGLCLTLIGAAVTASAVILSEDEAIEIGVSRFNGDNREQDLRLPAVQGLMKQSKDAKWGLLLIVAGTFVQLLGVAADWSDHRRPRYKA